MNANEGHETIHETKLNLRSRGGVSHRIPELTRDCSGGGAAVRKAGKVPVLHLYPFSISKYINPFELYFSFSRESVPYEKNIVELYVQLI